MSSKKINIEGTAIVEGVSRNGIIYEAAELDKFAPTLTGRPILKDHEGLTDNTIGKITESKSINDGKSVSYRGWIKEDGSGILEKIKDGRISEVSIGAMVGKLVKEKAEDTDFIARDMHALELSTTPVPGVDGTSVKQSENNMEYSEEMLKDMITESYDESNLKIGIKEEIRMTENEKREDNNAVNENIVATEAMKIAEEKLKVAEAKIAEMEKVRRSEAVEAYEKLCESKSLKAVNTEKLSIDAVKALTEQVEGVEEPAEESSEEKSEDDSKEDEEEKEKAESKTEETSDEKAEEKFNNYIVEQSDLGGMSFGKLD